MGQYHLGLLNMNIKSIIEGFTQHIAIIVQGKYISKWFYWILDKYYKLCGIQDEITSAIKEVKMLRIGIVGDLSMGNPQKFRHAMQEATSNSDITIQIGDCHPAYTILKSFHNQYPDKVFCVKGNHDENFESMNLPTQPWWHLPQFFLPFQSN